MVNERIPEVLIETIAHSVGVGKQEVKLHNTLAEDLRMDIHDLSELQYMLEDVFSCHITTYDLAKSETVYDVLSLIQQYPNTSAIAV